MYHPLCRSRTSGGTRTRSPRLRRPVPYPLGHEGCKWKLDQGNDPVAKSVARQNLDVVMMSMYVWFKATLIGFWEMSGEIKNELYERIIHIIIYYLHKNAAESESACLWCKRVRKKLSMFHFKVKYSSFNNTTGRKWRGKDPFINIQISWLT